ncbi:FAD-binding oxidoreductase [Methylobacterium sp. J-030]|uniref:FAD-binding oxidoreductase n=1 Tax=Methylobacterium sp. J-030 TaxID=2836627 RepID=UPI001FB8F9A7|nr:FAD-binding oxidoreductase [Methylobacterium sp. J-030]MCJ2068455.1 FAD-binding oxidoreductase [Methylobacterium sp. J-030]
MIEATDGRLAPVPGIAIRRAEFSGWGRYPRHQSGLVTLTAPADLTRWISGQTGVIARGNGRAYGDAAVGEKVTLSTRSLNRICAFDRQSGRITVEAGLLLSELMSVVVPLGFFPPVVPGTKFVTIGGMIAADVHGKNHHRDGGFGDHVEGLTLALPNGDVLSCARDENPELLDATIGGMGLTGTILNATFVLKPIETGFLRQTTIVAPDLAAAIAALSRTGDTTYTVAWIDCLARGASLGRSLIFAAEHAGRADLAASGSAGDAFPPPRPGRISVPVDLPGWTLNRLSVSAFNEAYFRLGAAKAGTPRLVEWNPYFFPLDGVGGWNRIYGRRGFLQYQCVIPTAQAQAVLSEILERVSRHGSASFLAVLKQLRAGRGLLSFPMEGLTLTLDLPMSAGVFMLLDALDTLVVASGGRLYLAKDARQSRSTFEAGYPNLPRMRDLRRATGAGGRVSSYQSARLGIQ